MELVIRRKKWLRGHRGGTLRSEKGAMCCLGFLGKACGLKNKQILNEMLLTEFLTDPRVVSSKDVLSNFSLIKEKLSTNIETALVNANDEVGVPQRKREENIKELMKMIDVNVKFTN